MHVQSPRWQAETTPLGRYHLAFVRDEKEPEWFFGCF
jgi:hypothetical protein